MKNEYEILQTKTRQNIPNLMMKTTRHLSLNKAQHTKFIVKNQNVANQTKFLSLKTKERHNEQKQGKTNHMYH